MWLCLACRFIGFPPNFCGERGRAREILVDLALKEYCIFCYKTLPTWPPFLSTYRRLRPSHSGHTIVNTHRGLCTKIRIECTILAMLMEAFRNTLCNKTIYTVRQNSAHKYLLLIIFLQIASADGTKQEL